MSAFVEYLAEVFEAFGTIHARRMFGGYGLYHNGLMFALVANDELFLKTDAQTRGLFEARELSAFTYVKNGKTTTMSYFSAPEELFDDPEQAKIWAERAYGAALRAKSS